MPRCPHRRTAKGSHASFDLGSVWLALAAAVFGGFALAGHLAVVIGYGFPLRPGFPVFIQIHGHLQLMGWAGLFVIGISLHFIPRLSSAPISQPRWISVLLWLIGLGLLLRLVCHSTLPYVHDGVWAVALRWTTATSGGARMDGCGDLPRPDGARGSG